MSEDQITASTTPRAIVMLTSILGLRHQGPGDPPSCTLDDEGTAIWRLNGGYIVTCSGLEEGGHWHLDRDDRPKPEVLALSASGFVPEEKA